MQASIAKTSFRILWLKMQESSFKSRVSGCEFFCRTSLIVVLMHIYCHDSEREE